MKKLVVMTVSLLAILTMVTAASADYAVDLTSGENDGWAIQFMNKGGLSQNNVSTYHGPGLETLLKKVCYSDNTYTNVVENQAPGAWYDGTEADWIGPMLGDAPEGLYAYTILLGTYEAAGDTWELVGGLAVDNALLYAVVWTGKGALVNDITDGILATGNENLANNGLTSLPHSLSSYGRLYDVAVALNPEGVDFTVGDEYFLTLFILNSYWKGGPNVQGLYSALKVEVTKATSDPTSTPEPVTLLILGLGVVGAGFARRRMK